MKFLIVGGDNRTLKLVEMLKNDGHEIKTYALKNSDANSLKSLENNDENSLRFLENSDANSLRSLKDNDANCLKSLKNIREMNFNAVIGPIPFTKDGENLNSQFTENKISLQSLLQPLENQTLIAGPISTTLKEKLEKNNIKIVDIMEVEELVIYNTIATAEGTIEIAIANTEKNLHESKILILGFGRVGKTLALKLKGLSQEIACAARKTKDLAWIETLGFIPEDINFLNEELNRYDIIINTIPAMILTKEKIKNIKQDALIIDLASKPGGADQEELAKANLKYIWALSLPGKVAPLSSASYIKDAIYSIMKSQ